MKSAEKFVYPMMIELNETIKETIYYVALPREVKDKWLELEHKAKTSYNPSYNLPTNTLKAMLSSYLDGVIDMKPVSNVTDDSKWLVSFVQININIVINCLKIWVDEFYIKGSLTKGYQRRNGENEDVSRVAKEFMELLGTTAFSQSVNKEVVLFEGGQAINKEGYQLYPLRLVNSLMGQSIFFNGIRTKLLYSSTNELVTDPHTFNNADDYYSFVIKFSVQTLPPDNKAYLNVDLSVRRWISKNEKNNGQVYLPNDKNCYIRVAGDRLQSIKTEYNKDNKEISWKSIDFRCFKECQIKCTVPQFTEVLACPGEYNHGKVGDVLIPYEEGITGINTTIKSGVTFIDRKTAFEFVKQSIANKDNISSVVKAVKIKKTVKKTHKDFSLDDDLIKNTSEYFLRQLDKALDSEKLTIEIYAELEIGKVLFDKLKEYFKTNSKHEIKYCNVDDIGNELVTTVLSKKDNLPGFEIKKEEIIKKIKKVNTPTLALIAIHDKEYFSKLNRKNNVDPKKAIRCGFAETGRLTQFITFEQFNKEEKRIAGCDEINEKKKQFALKNDKKIKATSKNEKSNKVINGAICDGFRQLGVVFDYAGNKNMAGKKIVGVHVCNYKKNMYGNLPIFPIIVSYDVDSSKIMVYCDLIDKVDVPYWRAILSLSKLALAKNIVEISKGISATTIYRRLDRIINEKDCDSIIIIDADGTSRQLIKGITNSEIDKAERNDFRQIKKMLLNDGRYLDLIDNKGKFSIIRLRHNAEVPSYLTMDKEIENKAFMQQSGIFKYKDIYYSIDGKPSHEMAVYNKLISKANDKSSFSHRNLLEIYPMFVSGEENNHEEDEMVAVGVVHLLREVSIQFTTQKTILPLPLHLAEKMEEYF